MSRLRRMLARLAGLGTGRQDEARLREEIAEHLALLAAEKERAGLPRDEARRQAALKFGGVEAAKEAWREERRLAWLEATGRDLARAARRLRAAPGFTAVVVLTLALGIGATTALFSVMDAVMWRSMPVAHPNRLVLMEWSSHRWPSNSNLLMWYGCPGTAGGGSQNPRSCSFSGPMFHGLKRRLAPVAQVFAFVAVGQVGVGTRRGVVLTPHNAYAVSGSLLPALGVRPAAGRLLGPGDDRPGAPPAVVISYAYWQLRFGGAARAIGAPLTVGGIPATLVGVMPRGFVGLEPGMPADMWLPLRLAPRLVAGWPRTNDAHALWLWVGARLRRGVSPRQAEVRGATAFLDAALSAKVFNRGDSARLVVLPAARGFLQVLPERFGPPTEALAFVVILLLLIACANVAGLLLARAPGRQREIAICLALGAGRGRIARQLFAESLWLAVGGGLLGLGIGVWGARALAATLTAGSQGGFRPAMGPDLTVLGFAAGVTLFCAVLSGLMPAWRASAVAPAPALKLAPGHVARRRRFGLGTGQGLVIGQVALSVVALAGAGLLVRTLAKFDHVRLGFNPRQILVVGLDDSATGLKGRALDGLYERVRRRLAALPGVTAVSYAQMPLLSGGRAEGKFARPGRPHARMVAASILYVGPHFFATIGVPVLLGREFETADLASKRSVAVVNRRFARLAFGSVDPVGREIRGVNGPASKIIGVVANARYAKLRGRLPPMVYFLARRGFFDLRTAGVPSALIPAVRGAVRGVSRTLPVAEALTERQQISQLLWQQRLLARLSSVFASLALLLAALGLYGLLAFEVARSSRETGIRIALGAKPRTILRRTVARGLGVALAGGAIGLAAAAVLTRLLQAHLFGVSALDPVSFAAALALLVLVAGVACYLPARRAAALDPAQVMREE